MVLQKTDKHCFSIIIVSISFIILNTRRLVFNLIIPKFNDILKV